MAAQRQSKQISMPFVMPPIFQNLWPQHKWYKFALLLHGGRLYGRRAQAAWSCLHSPDASGRHFCDFRGLIPHAPGISISRTCRIGTLKPCGHLPRLCYLQRPTFQNSQQETQGISRPRACICKWGSPRVPACQHELWEFPGRGFPRYTAVP